jgi:hypothetical protein
VLKQRGPEQYAKAGLNAAAQRQKASEFRGIQEATGLPDGDVARILDGHLDGLLADARVSDDPEGDETTLRQTIAANNEQLREKMLRTYGVKDGEQLLDRTVRFVRRIRSSPAFCESTGSARGRTSSRGSRPTFFRQAGGDPCVQLTRRSPHSRHSTRRPRISPPHGATTLAPRA